MHVLKLSQQLLELADNGDRDRFDTSCGILFGTLRDYAYKLRSLAQEEIEIHKKSGNFDAEDHKELNKI